MIIALGAFAGYRYFVADSRQISSIAVLPFANAAGDRETEFLSDGIAETLINDLARMPQLKVIGRSSAFRYRGREAEPQTIGQELNVGSFLSGRVLLRGDSLIVQVDLIKTDDAAQL